MSIDLVTGGCSFTEYDGCWPYWLIRKLKETHPNSNLALHNTGVGGAGNDLISRKIIHKVNKLLKEKKNPKHIIVGIMWSGANRKSIYSDDGNNLRMMFNVDQPLDDEQFKDHFKYGQRSKYPNRPHKWPSDDHYGRYILLTPGNTYSDSGIFNSFAENVYKNIHNRNIAIADTYEHVLRVQWYLEKHKIKYFMQTYMPLWDSNKFDSPKEMRYLKAKEHPQVGYLKEMINWSKFTDTSCWQWVKDNSQLDWNAYDSLRDITRLPGDMHPTSDQQKEYVDQYLWPYLINKKIFAISPLLKKNKGIENDKII